MTNSEINAHDHAFAYVTQFSHYPRSARAYADYFELLWEETEPEFRIDLSHDELFPRWWANHSLAY